MVKITFENNETKTELSGRCIFAAVIDPEGDGDMATALIASRISSGCSIFWPDLQPEGCMET